MKQIDFLNRLLAKNDRRPKSVLLYLFAFVFFIGTQNVLAQEKVISGKVVDDTNSPLPGVSILLKGTTIGTDTDFDGLYQFSIPEDAILVVSYMGYVTQEIVVGSKSTIDVTMVPDLNNLDEVVVIGYGTMRRRDMTGAVASVKGSDLAKADPTSFQNALAGRVAGVQVTQTDNGPGAGVKILIRGGSSLTSGNQPLFVIDGFPIVPDDDPSSNPLADISPTQIESMEILKDASATAIYGAQGANGVVIITTKKGKEGQPQINVGASYGVSQMVNVPKIYEPDAYLDYVIGVNGVEQYFDPEAELQHNRWLEIQNNGEPGIKWIDEITQLANTWNANINFMGGAKGMRYAVSGDYLSQEGIIIGSKFERINLNTNLEQKIGEKLRVGATLKIASSQNEGMINNWDEETLTKKALQQNPFADPDRDPNDPSDPDDPSGEYNDENMTTYINDVDKQFETTRMLGNLFLEYKIIDGLKFYTSYGFNKYSKDQHEFLPKSTRAGGNTGGRARFDKSKTNNNVFQARLNYNKEFGEHRIYATAGFESKRNDRIRYRSEITQFEDDSRGVYDLSSAAISAIPSNNIIESSMASYLGRVQYNFKDKYLVTASLRADGSSKFGTENKWGYFPSAAIGWVASEEGFIKNLNTFDLLKLRMSYGKTGNDQIPSYASLASLGTEKYIFNDGLYAGMVPNSVANPNLKWETTSQFNVGLDFAFFKNRLLFTADAYYKETTDLLLDVQLPLTSGFEKAIQNVGSISNKGLEFSINSVNIDKNDFTWTTNFTMSFNRSEVLDLGDKPQMRFTRKFSNYVKNDILLRVGEQVGIYYGYIEDQVLNSETEIANSPQNGVLENEAGAHKLYDVNGDGIIDPFDMVPLAKTVPDYTGGLGNDFTYKNFDLSIFMRWVVGNDIINGNMTYMDRGGNRSWNSLPALQENRFSAVNPDGTFHGVGGDTYRNLMRSMYVEDGSFLKIDYITLGYNFTESLLSKAKIRNLRLYTRVSNPFMLTRYSGWDPEVSTGSGTVAKVGPGSDVGTYPRSMTFTFGLTLGL
jgi:TonB-linked SusC/RagA family outer membrane protein